MIATFCFIFVALGVKLTEACEFLAQDIVLWGESDQLADSSFNFWNFFCLYEVISVK